MQVLNIHGVGDARLDPREPPKAGETDVVVKVRACGICGSDLSYIKMGGLRSDGSLTPLGHEAAGEIMEIGSAVTGVTLGQRVAINPMQTSNFIGNGGTDGGFSQAVLVGDARLGDSLLPIADEVSFEVAALAEPLAVSLHGVNQAELAPGAKVAVFGCGPIGLGMVLWLVDRGFTDVVAMDMSDERLERASALGAAATINPGRENVAQRLAEIHGTVPFMNGPCVATDAYLDAAGAPNILGDFIAMARPKARLVVTAVYMKPVELNLMRMLSKELILTTAAGYPTEMNDVVAALPRIRDKAATLISHRFPLGEVVHALGVAGTPASAKVMIRLDD